MRVYSFFFEHVLDFSIHRSLCFAFEYAQQNFTTLEMLKRVYHLIIDLVLLRFCIVDLYFWLVNLFYQAESKIGEKCTDSVLLDINMGSENNRWFFWAWNFLKQLWNMFGQDHFYVVNKSTFNFKFYISHFYSDEKMEWVRMKFQNYKVYSCFHSWDERIFCWKKPHFSVYEARILKVLARTWSSLGPLRSIVNFGK